MSGPTENLQVEQRLKELVEAFSGNPKSARGDMRALLASEPDAFLAAAVPLIKGDTESAGLLYLLDLLQASNLLPVCDPSLLTVEEDVQIARKIMETDPFVDLKLARRISTSGSAGVISMNPAVAGRILEVLDVISDRSRILPMLVQLFRHPNPFVRSKAALLIGRGNKSAQWAEGLMNEPDGRVRANSIEALWGVDTPAARAVFWEATKDRHNRVAGNALLGLYRVGDTASIRPILQMATHPQAGFRSTAAWIMGETDDPRFLPTLAQMIQEPDSKARHSVFRAIARIRHATSDAAAAPRLRVCICDAKPAPDGWRLVRAAVGLEDGAEVPGLLATRIVLWENSRMISDYAVQQSRAPESLSIGIAVSVHGGPAGADDSATAALDACVQIRQKQDRWVIAAYPGAAADPQTPPAAKSDQRPGAPGTDSELLSKELRNPSVVRPTAAEAAQYLLNAIASGGGSRNLLLLPGCADEPDFGDDQRPNWDAAVKKALSSSVSIHTVALAGSTPASLALILDLCEQTGGTSLLTDSPSGVVELCQKLYLTLLHPHDILYCPEPGAQTQARAELKLQVYAGQGYGEDVLVLP